MFLAGMIPGLIMLASLMITGYLIGLKRGYGYGDPVIKKQIPDIVPTFTLIHPGSYHCKCNYLRLGQWRPKPAPSLPYMHLFWLSWLTGSAAQQHLGRINPHIPPS